MRLPTVIVLGGVELRRQKSTYYKQTDIRFTWLNEWACAKNWNTLERNSRTKKWCFRGGPLDWCPAGVHWADTPEQAYKVFLVFQIAELRKDYEENHRKLCAALEAVDPGPFG